MTKDKEEIIKNDEKEENEVAVSEEDVAIEEIAEAADAPDETPSPETETIDDELSRVKSEAAEYLDGWQRARAEFANYKKRIERENEDARQRITSEIILHYLSIMDDLERALENAPEEEDFLEWVSGIDLIHQKFGAILESAGVEPIETDGERFDPNLHEAISYEESEDFESGSVIAVTLRGYKLGDRIIRPTMVRVAK